VTRSEFFIAVGDEFGALQGRSLLRDLVIQKLGNRSADQALADGVAPREVWFALCGAMDVPEHRWHGAGLPRKTADTP
jgi:hypothetical protein|tara:strand:+ start:1018 stop:1251 length:234 start_codon:yes stop_codon:yes gene_type:complete